MIPTMRRGRVRATLCLVLITLVGVTSCSTGAGTNTTDGVPGTSRVDGDPAGSGNELVTGHVVTDDMSDPQLPVTVRGDDGVSVTVSDVSRIVTLRASISEVIYYLGLGDNVVGRDESTTFDEAAGVPNITNGHQIAAEALLSLDPTVVLVDTDTGPPEVIEQLRSVGVPVVVFEPVVRIEDIGAHMVAVAEAVGLHDRGVELAGATQERLDDLDAGSEAVTTKPRVAFLYLRGNAGVYLLGGPGSGADAMIAAAGGIDVGTDDGLGRAFTPLTNEALVSSAPDIILVTTTGLESVGGVDGLVAMPGVAQTPAGRSRSVVSIEDGVLYSFGVRTPETVDAMARRFAELTTDGRG